jgi:hypothetical protein
VQFVAGDRKRRTVRLGKVGKRIAEEIKVKVEALSAAATAGLSWDTETARWVASLQPVLADRLAAVGLIPKRAAAEIARLKPFLDAYVVGRTDVKVGTATNLRIGASRLVAYFGADRELASITPGDCDDWARWLMDRYAGATIGNTERIAANHYLQVREEDFARYTKRCSNPPQCPE